MYYIALCKFVLLKIVVINGKRMKYNLKYIIVVLSLLLVSANTADDSTKMQDDNAQKTVFVFELRKDINKQALRIIQRGFEEAGTIGASYIIIQMNTYGGRVDIADSIRTKILNCKIPVIIFIDNQAISAGALISIAADSIYMRQGGSIGAASVVNQSGEVMPDKYQSFMRSVMRATAESHGKDTVISGNDTIISWHRDPHIAEAMVDPDMYVEGISDTGKVLTLTAAEAINVGYCEGMAENLDDVIRLAGLKECRIEKYKPSGMDRFVTFLMNPILQGFLIMLIIGGIYFELQTPGIGFPLGLAVAAALIYFAPLYVEGFAQNWEIMVFLAGIALIAVEVFVIPGFGVVGVTGIVLVILGLTMSLVENYRFDYEGTDALDDVFKASVRVILSIFLAFGGSLYLSRLVGRGSFFRGLALEAVQEQSEGYISIDKHQKDMIGKTGAAHTVLRPSGRVKIEGEIFDAKAEIGFIDKGEKVKVLRDEAGQLYVIKVE